MIEKRKKRAWTDSQESVFFLITDYAEEDDKDECYISFVGANNYSPFFVIWRFI